MKKYVLVLMVLIFSSCGIMVPRYPIRLVVRVDLSGIPIDKVKPVLEECKYCLNKRLEQNVISVDSMDWRPGNLLKGNYGEFVAEGNAVIHRNKPSPMSDSSSSWKNDVSKYKRRLKNCIELPGAVEFKLVDDTLSRGINFSDLNNGILKSGVSIPDWEEMLFLWGNDLENSRLVRKAPVVLQKFSILTEKDLQDIGIVYGQFGDYQIQFSLEKGTAEKFSDFTGRNVGKRLAIIIDGKIRSTPVIRSRLYDKAVISGGFTLEESRELAILLRSGRMPVKTVLVTNVIADLEKTGN
jgi:hypothetical protein